MTKFDPLQDGHMYANDKWVALTGYHGPLENWPNCIHPQDRSDFLAAYAHYISSIRGSDNRPFEYSLRCVHADSSTSDLKCFIAPDVKETPTGVHVQGWYGVVVDARCCKELEELQHKHIQHEQETAQQRMALKESEERFIRMAEQAGVGVVMTDRQVSFFQHKRKLVKLSGPADTL